MKLTLETTDPENKYQKKVIIEVPYDGLSFADVLDSLVFPALLGMGYSQDNIDELLGGDPEKENEDTYIVKENKKRLK